MQDSTGYINVNGQVVFEQNDVEMPRFYSQLATKVIVSKYFYGEQGTDERENSMKQLVHRVSRTIADWAIKDKVFKTKKEGEVGVYSSTL